MTRRTIPLCLAAMAASLASCEKIRYDIEMALRDDVLLRQVTVSRTDQAEGGRPLQLADEMVARFQKLYETHKVDDTGLRHTFRGQFKGRTPDDVGGAGFVVSLQTPLGSAAAYIERFRGDDDLLGQVNRRTRAVDRITDLMIGWLSKELGRQEGFDRLRGFLDKDLRADLKNLSLYAWLASNDASRDADPNTREAAGKEIAARAVQYLLERGYLKPADSPLIYRIAYGERKQQPRLALALIQRVLTSRRLPADKGTMDAIGRLFDDPEQTGRSLDAYLKETEDYKRELARQKQDPNSQPDWEDPEPISVLLDPLREAAGFELLFVSEEVEIKLACPAAPLATNGRYDELAKVLSWSRQLQHADSKVLRMPILCYAVWARPDEKFQQEHFGRLALQGQDLLDYCLWHRSLDAEEAKRWETFLSSLKPGQDLAEKLTAFQLHPPPDQPPEKIELEEPPPDYAERVKALILNALGAPATGPSSGPAGSP